MKDLKQMLAKLDSEIFTESVQNELVQIVEEKVIAAKKQALEEAAVQHAKNIEELDEQYSKKLEELMEAVDEDHAKKLKDATDTLDEDHAKKLKELEDAIDEDHSKKMQDVIDSLDEDHTDKLEKIVKAMDEQYAQKLQEIADAYEAKYETKMVEKLSDYLDTYLEECAPTNVIVDNVRLQKLEETVTQLKKVLHISEISLNDEVREAIIEAKSALDEKDKIINSLMTEKINLNKKFKQNEAKTLLEQKTKDMSPAKAAYINRFFNNASVEDINERLDEASRAYEKDRKNSRKELQQITEAASNKAKIPSNTEVINESKSDELDPVMDLYVNQLEKSYKARS